MSGAVVLHSGGLDSSTLLYGLRIMEPINLRQEVKALIFDYGQRHEVEIKYALRFCDRHDIEREVVNLQAINKLIAMGSQAGRVDVPLGHYADETMKATVVPNRNMIMLAVAVGHAIKLNYSEVYYAAHGGDHAIYPDCRPDFFHTLATAVELGNAWTPVTLKAPFINSTKADIVKAGAVIGMPFDETWSCYRGESIHCGQCGTCVERKEAFQLAGVKDPTTYANY